MTLREIFPQWLCKITFSVPKNCSEKYSWLDFTIYEFIFTLVIFLVIKWIVYRLFSILSRNKPDKNMDSTIISPSLLEKEIDFANGDIEDLKGNDLDFVADTLSLEEEPMNLTKRGDNYDENLDKDIETSILNITRNGDKT